MVRRVEQGHCLLIYIYIPLYTWNPNVPYLFGKDLLLEAKQRTSGLQATRYNTMATQY